MIALLRFLSLMTIISTFFLWGSPSLWADTLKSFSLKSPASRMLPISAQELLLFDEHKGSFEVLNLDDGIARPLITLGEHVIDFSIRARPSTDQGEGLDFLGAAIVSGPDEAGGTFYSLLIFNRTEILQRRSFPSFFKQPRVLVGNADFVVVYDAGGISLWIERSKYSGFKLSDPNFDDQLSSVFGREDRVSSVSSHIYSLQYAGSGLLYFAFQPRAEKVSLLKIGGTVGRESVDRLDDIPLNRSEAELFSQSFFPKSALYSEAPQSMIWANRARGSLSFLDYYREFNALNSPVSIQIESNLKTQRGSVPLLIATSASQDLVALAEPASQKIQLYRRLKKGIVKLGFVEQQHPIEDLAFLPSKQIGFQDTLLILKDGGKTITALPSPYVSDRVVQDISATIFPRNNPYASLQKDLLLLGYSPGAVDGMPGLMTRTALRAFQRDVGLKPTGDLDGGTEVALERKISEFLDNSLRRINGNTTGSRQSAVQDLIDYGIDADLYNKILSTITEDNTHLTNEGIFNALYLLTEKKEYNRDERQRLSDAISHLSSERELGPQTINLLETLKESAILP